VSVVVVTPPFALSRPATVAAPVVSRVVKRPVLAVVTPIGVF
jgi:hypothetical protein